MMLSFDRGDSRRPKGHALLYFRAWADPSALFATYLIVPPIAVEISKYIPPMFAAQFQQMGGASGVTVFPYPPIPERVEGYELLERLAAAREDDLISGGSVDASSPHNLLQATAEAAQQYFGDYSSYVESLTAAHPEPLPEASSLEVSEVLYGLMGERDRLAELAKLSGQLRYAVAGKDDRLAAEAVGELQRLGKFLAEKYRLEEVIQSARRPGPEGDRLTQLYLGRAYRLADEDYEAVRQLEAEIHQLKSE